MNARLENGREVRLVPMSSLSRIVAEDGHYSCNHSDATPCDLPGHQTVLLYEVVDL